MFKKSFSAFIVFLCCFMMACHAPKSLHHESLKEGDLLFQHLNCGPLCEAIEAVTQGVEGKKFAHCAMIVKIDDSLKVIEAIGNKVQTNSITAFFARSGDTNGVHNVTLGRVKNKYKSLLKKAVEFAKKQIGQPYDDEFLLDNGKWYCSELLYESFKAANNQKDFFILSPMTYKQPGSNDFFPAWIDYYRQLKAPIPEGKPGINPGSISRSDKIEIIQYPVLIK
ncbi:MAG: YiiX/YebB-like N1pC/P60 family cysteine hydrolase [Bacteroidota bacterium]